MSKEKTNLPKSNAEENVNKEDVNKEACKGAAKKRGKQSRGRERSKGNRGTNRKPIPIDVTNHISWYNKYPNRVLANCQVNFQYPLGTKYVLGAFNNGTADFTEPGLMALHVISTYPIRDGAADPINKQFDLLFTQVRATISGNYKNYEPTDLAIHTMAIAEFIAYMSWVRRLYASLNTYSPDNKYLPKMLIEANGVNFESLKYNKMAFWDAINQLAIRSAVLYLPGVMDYMKRKQFMFDNVFSEAGPNTQLYMYVPESFGRLTYNVETGLAEIQRLTVYHQNKLVEWTEVIQYGENLLNAILTDEDAMMINGDLRKCFPKSELERMPIPFNIALNLNNHDPGALEQILNATILPSSVVDNVVHVDAKTGSYLSSIPKIEPGSYTDTFLLRQPLRMITGTSPENVLHATTLTVTGEELSEGNALRLQCGTEVVRRVYMYTLDRTFYDYTDSNPTSFNRVPLASVIKGAGATKTLDDQLKFLQIAVTANHFLYRPVTWIISDNADSSNSIYPMGEAFVSGFVTPEVVQGIHDVALQSLFTFNI